MDPWLSSPTTREGRAGELASGGRGWRKVSSSAHPLLRACGGHAAGLWERPPCPVWKVCPPLVITPEPEPASHTLPKLLPNLLSPSKPVEHPTLPRGPGELGESKGNVGLVSTAVTPAPLQCLVWSEGQSWPPIPIKPRGLWPSEATSSGKVRGLGPPCSPAVAYLASRLVCGPGCMCSGA